MREEKWRRKFKSKWLAYRRLVKIKNALECLRKEDVKDLLPDERALLRTVEGDLRNKWEGVRGKARALLKELHRLGEHSPLWRVWLKDVSGISSYTAGLLDILLLDRDFKTRSSLKVYCGWYIDDVNKRLVRPRHGKTIKYSPLLRTIMYNIRERLYQYNNKYREIANLYTNYYLSKYTNRYTNNKYTNKYTSSILFNINSKYTDNSIVHSTDASTVHSTDNNNSKDIKKWRVLKQAKTRMLVLFLSHLWEVIYLIKHKKRPPEPKPDSVLGVYIPPIRDKVAVKGSHTSI